MPVGEDRVEIVGDGKPSFRRRPPPRLGRAVGGGDLDAIARSSRLFACGADRHAEADDGDALSCQAFALRYCPLPKREVLRPRLCRARISRSVAATSASSAIALAGAGSKAGEVEGGVNRLALRRGPGKKRVRAARPADR